VRIVFLGGEDGLLGGEDGLLSGEDGLLGCAGYGCGHVILLVMVVAKVLLVVALVLLVNICAAGCGDVLVLGW
jgi:hypothetical protein